MLKCGPITLGRAYKVGHVLFLTLFSLSCSYTHVRYIFSLVTLGQAGLNQVPYLGKSGV